MWLIIGCLLLGAIILWYGFVFYSTRRRSHRSLATLKPKPYTPPDLTDLKQKYQRLIDEIERNYTAGELSSRKAHQKLSHVLRMFVVEINGHRVDTLTLRDLEKTRPGGTAAPDRFPPPGRPGRRARHRASQRRPHCAGAWDPRRGHSDLGRGGRGPGQCVCRRTPRPSRPARPAPPPPAQARLRATAP